MNIKSQIVTLSIFTWLGMVAFPALGLVNHANEIPNVQMECPNHVWDMIEQGGLTREDIRESDETMKRYDCDLVLPEEEPFNPTNWLLFGIVTGFTVGAMFLKNPKTTAAPRPAPSQGHPSQHPDPSRRQAEPEQKQEKPPTRQAPYTVAIGVILIVIVIIGLIYE